MANDQITQSRKIKAPTINKSLWPQLKLYILFSRVEMRFKPFSLWSYWLLVWNNVKQSENVEKKEMWSKWLEKQYAFKCNANSNEPKFFFSVLKKAARTHGTFDSFTPKQRKCVTHIECRCVFVWRLLSSSLNE